MLEGLLRLAALVACVIVLVSFALFAVDESRAASQRSAEAVAGLQATRSADPDPSEERARERAHGTVREAIDDADDVLLSPFSWTAGPGTNKWVQRGVPGLLALVVYGFGLGFLARFARGRA